MGLYNITFNTMFDFLRKKSNYRITAKTQLGSFKFTFKTVSFEHAMVMFSEMYSGPECLEINIERIDL